MRAQEPIATRARTRVNDIGVLGDCLFERRRWLRLTTRAHVPILAEAVAVSQIIEPTGPVMGPNAMADVTPLGGRQELR